MMKTSFNPFAKGMLPKLEKFIKIALAKLKNIWAQENASNGIRFYIEMDD